MFYAQKDTFMYVQKNCTTGEVPKLLLLDTKNVLLGI